MRRAKLEGRHIGRPKLDVDHAAVIRERQARKSLTDVAQAHGISRGLGSRIVKQALIEDTRHKGPLPDDSQLQENRPPKSAA